MVGHQRIAKCTCLSEVTRIFEFVYSMVTLFRSLLYHKEAVVNLHGKNKDIVSGVSTVM